MQHLAACECLAWRRHTAGCMACCVSASVDNSPCPFPATGRIARAWRRFLHSPGRQRKVAAATAIQAAWRGSTGRRRAAQLLARHRVQLALLAELRAAADACDLQRAQQAAAQLQAAGAGAEPARLLAALQLRAQEAAEAVQAAAARGGAEGYQAAAAAARRYAHLAPAAEEAAATFAARVAAAERAVELAVQGGSLPQCKEAMAAAAALGVDAAVLRRAEQSAAERNNRAAAALQAAVQAAPFSAEAFAACSAAAQQFGLHADVARAQRALQLRRHRAAGALEQLAAGASAADVEAACHGAAQLGLHAEARAAQVRLAQRQAAVAEALQQAARGGSLAQFRAALEQAVTQRVCAATQQACREQLRSRQAAAEAQLQHAAGHGDIAAIEQGAQQALALGLEAAVEAAAARANERRRAAAQRLATSTRAACAFAEAAEADSPRCAEQAQQRLHEWAHAARQLHRAGADRGSSATIPCTLPASASWPAELQGWLEDARQAASLGLQPSVAAAAGTLAGCLESLLAEARLAAGGSQHSLPSSSGSVDCTQAAPATPAGRLLARLHEWRALQQRGMLARVAALSAEEAAAEEGGCVLDVSGQGLTRLEPPQTLHGLWQALPAPSINELAGSAAGLQALRRLTALDASGNQLHALPSLAGELGKDAACRLQAPLTCPQHSTSLHQRPFPCRRLDQPAPPGSELQPAHVGRPAWRRPRRRVRPPD